MHGGASPARTLSENGGLILRAARAAAVRGCSWHVLTVDGDIVVAQPSYDGQPVTARARREQCRVRVEQVGLERPLLFIAKAGICTQVEKLKDGAGIIDLRRNVQCGISGTVGEIGVRPHFQ